MSSFLIVTPYSRSIPDLNSSSCVEEPTFNYTSYDLFCLNKKLELYLSTINKSYRVSFTSQELNNEMVLTVNILNGDKIVDLNAQELKNIQEFVNLAVVNPHVCPLLSIELLLSLGRKYPKVWMRSLLPYLTVPAILNPYIENETIYIEMDPESDYLSTYNTISRSLYHQIENYYNLGVIVCNQVFAKNWALIPLYIEHAPTPPSDILLNLPYLSIPSQDSPSWYAVDHGGYENVLNDWDTSLSALKSGGGSRRETDRNISELRQFFPTINWHGTADPQESINEGIKLNDFVKPREPEITVMELYKFNILEHGNSATRSLNHLESDINLIYQEENEETKEDMQYGLYIPTWKDDRLGQPVEFLLNQLHGQNTISIEVNNLPTRHNIALQLNPYAPLFIGNKIILPTINYKSTEQLVSLIFNIIHTSNGTVVTLGLSSDIFFNKLQHYVHELYPDATCSLYRIIDPIKPFIFSCSISPEIDLNSTQKTLYEYLSKIQNIT